MKATNNLIPFSLIVITVMCMLYFSLEQNEVIECNQWKEQSTRYPNYFITEWQDQQCKAHDIIIPAKVEHYQK